MLSSVEAYSLEALQREVSIARGIQDFADGAYGHCISLTSEAQLAAEFRSHHNNVPHSGALQHCPCLRGIFESFRTEKASFRLLRRAPRTAYGLHDDRDKGERIFRFQIPILTNEASFLVVMREDAPLLPLAQLLSHYERARAEPIPFDFEELRRVFGDRFELFSLPPGHLYYFDTDRIHTAINAGAHERIVLGIDLVVNDWLEEWMERTLTRRIEPCAPETLPAASWNWSALRHGLLSHPRVEPRAAAS